MLILDFDGTLTDAEAEGRPFRVGYLQDLATIVGQPVAEVTALCDRFTDEMMSDRDSHGWMFDGYLVAPAAVDPYLRVMPVARMLLDHFGVLPDESTRSRLLDGILYKYNYPKSAICFRPGAYEFLSAREGSPTWIITNSATDPVREKVRQLAVQAGAPGSLDWLVERVHGFGKKYVIDPSFDLLPESMELAGLARPILLRRKRYCELLETLRAEASCRWSDVVVVGDIFELDLCVPLHFGARVGLLANDFTPPYEQAYLRGHERGAVLHSLAEAGSWVESSAASC
jgi:hypothetical protein